MDGADEIHRDPYEHIGPTSSAAVEKRVAQRTGMAYAGGFVNFGLVLTALLSPELEAIYGRELHDLRSVFVACGVASLLGIFLLLLRFQRAGAWVTIAVGVVMLPGGLIALLGGWRVLDGLKPPPPSKYLFVPVEHVLNPSVEAQTRSDIDDVEHRTQLIRAKGSLKIMYYGAGLTLLGLGITLYSAEPFAAVALLLFAFAMACVGRWYAERPVVELREKHFVVRNGLTRGVRSIVYRDILSVHQPDPETVTVHTSSRGLVDMPLDLLDAAGTRSLLNELRKYATWLAPMRRCDLEMAEESER